MWVSNIDVSNLSVSLAAALPTEQPGIVVLDELLYLMDGDRAFEGMLQRYWDRIPDEQLPAASAFGGYWARSNDIEIDVIGADRVPVAWRLQFVGSIKSLECSLVRRGLDCSAMRR